MPSGVHLAVAWVLLLGLQHAAAATTANLSFVREETSLESFITIEIAVVLVAVVALLAMVVQWAGS